MLSPLPEQISLQTNSREFRESEENYYARSQNLTQLRNVYPLINPGGSLVGLTWAQLVCESLLPSGIKECRCGCPTRQGHQALLVPQYLLCLLCKGQSAKVKVRVGLWSHNKTGHDKHIDCMTVVWQTNNMTVHNKHQSCDSSNTPVMWLSHDKHADSDSDYKAGLSLLLQECRMNQQWVSWKTQHTTSQQWTAFNLMQGEGQLVVRGN